MSSAMQTVNISLVDNHKDRGYPIHIGPDLLSQPELLRRHIHGTQVLVVSNETIAPLYQETVAPALNAYNVRYVNLPDGEAHKNLNILNSIFDELLTAEFDRSCTLIALGGGVVGDMTGYAAASYQRGVDFIQIPTTLLAQVDSSVGGKTGVNHALGKNMIGAFHQPNCVIADTTTLSSLPDSELRSGLAEVIKYGLIIDSEFFHWLEENMPAVLSRDPVALAYIIRRSCEIKAEIVTNDERERGQRALLNLGHTFGHAIESALGYGSWLHGEAVAAGTAMAMDLSWRMGWLPQEERARALELFEQVGLPLAPPATMTVEKFLQYMQRDKKTLDGRLRLILMKSIGDAVVSDDFPQQTLQETLAYYCSTA